MWKQVRAFTLYDHLFKYEISLGVTILTSSNEFSVSVFDKSFNTLTYWQNRSDYCNNINISCILLITQMAQINLL